MPKYKTTRDLASQVSSHWQGRHRDAKRVITERFGYSDNPQFSTSVEQCLSAPRCDTEDAPGPHQTGVRIEWKQNEGSDSQRKRGLADPEVWGSPFWFSLHNGANHYPITASPCVVSRMVGFIRGLPMMLPCVSCKDHANTYIERAGCDLEEHCKGRDKLFAFFVDFHNYVNDRYGKPSWSIEKAKRFYSGYAEQTMKYGEMSDTKLHK